MCKKLIYIIIGISVSLLILYITLHNANDFGTHQLAEKNIKFIEQWGLYNTGQLINGVKGTIDEDINAIKAWDLTKGSESIIVGILDTGIEIENTEISHAIYINKNEIPNNCIDDDLNGYIDDINGWNFYNNNNNIYNNYLHDYHGTYIAGIIAANHSGGDICGIAPNIKILPLKFMSGSSGSTIDAVDAIKYAYEMGARIINCSWDSTIYDEELEKTIATYKDVIFICSAGKYRQDLSQTPVYPASYNLQNIITVGAVDNCGNLYDYSGYGQDVDVWAPGKDIISILPENDFIYSEGTSVATAYISGIVALVKSYNPKLTTLEVISIIKTCGSNNNNSSSYAIIDAYDCLLLAKNNK